MKSMLRSLAAASALVLMATSGALAEWKPSGPITMLIGFAAGGGADTQARMIAEELEKRHGWQIIPEQATGGGGAKLSAKIKDMPNDGTVIGLAVTDTQNGVIVKEVAPGGAAEKQGLPVGGLLVAVQSQDMTEPDSTALMGKAEIGSMLRGRPLMLQLVPRDAAYLFRPKGVYSWGKKRE